MYVSDDCLENDFVPMINKLNVKKLAIHLLASQTFSSNFLEKNDNFFYVYMILYLAMVLEGSILL